MRRLFVVLFLAAALNVNADVFMKQKQHTDAFEMMGQKIPAEDTIQRIWMTDSKIKNDSEKTSFIMDTINKRMTVINHANQTYTEIPLDLGAQMAVGDDEKKAGMQEMMKKMTKLDIKVTATGETQTINDWKCQKYLQELTTAMGPIKIEVWATQDLGVDVTTYAKLQSAALAMLPGMAEALKTALKEMQKVKGVAVRSTSTSTIMGNTIKTQTELLEIREGKAPAGVFKVPDDYTQKSMMGQQ